MEGLLLLSMLSLDAISFDEEKFGFISEMRK